MACWAAYLPNNTLTIAGSQGKNLRLICFPLEGNLRVSDNRPKQEDLMVVVRDIFRLRFGLSKEAMPLWKEAAASLRKSGYGAVDIRLLTVLSPENVPGW